MPKSIEDIDRQIAALKEQKKRQQAQIAQKKREGLRSCKELIGEEVGILMIVYSTWCWKLEPKCKVSSKMLSRIVLFSISVVALEFGAVLFYSTLSATDQKSISSLEKGFSRRSRSRIRFLICLL